MDGDGLWRSDTPEEIDEAEGAAANGEEWPADDAVDDAIGLDQANMDADAWEEDADEMENLREELDQLFAVQPEEEA